MKKRILLTLSLALVAGAAPANAEFSATLTQHLHASDASEPDNFGSAIAVEHDTLVIGAEAAGGANGIARGAAYVFERSGSGWVEKQKLTADPISEAQVCGTTVALSGDTILLGCQGPFVYVFTRKAGSFSLAQKVSIGGDRNADYGLALSGDTAVINKTDAVDTSAHVLVRGANGFVESQQIKGAIGAFTLSGDDLIVSEAGVSVYHRTNGTFVKVQNIPSAAGPNQGFGDGVALAGDTILVGGGGRLGTSDDEMLFWNYPGAAFFVPRESGAWGAPLRVSDVKPLCNDQFGHPIAMRGDIALINRDVFAQVDGTWARQTILPVGLVYPGDVDRSGRAVGTKEVFVGIQGGDEVQVFGLAGDAAPDPKPMPDPDVIKCPGESAQGGFGPGDSSGSSGGGGSSSSSAGAGGSGGGSSGASAGGGCSLALDDPGSPWELASAVALGLAGWARRRDRQRS